MREFRAKYCIPILLLFVQGSLCSQTDTAYSFIVAGHAYGAHSGTNIGLHPPFLASLDEGFDPLTAFFVFTGDIVNHSTEESWTKVDQEMSAYGLPFYYAMGNHDANSVGQEVFIDKFGGLYYSFYQQNDLMIVLNSIEADRAISAAQLSFLEDLLENADSGTKNIFIFFHEVIWNSHEKYREVRSNSRSRYDQIVNYSNYWEEVHPVLEGYSDKNFYLVSGDVGGNPDAISAFYDNWDNVYLLSSGMGEVTDENYLQVNVSETGSVNFILHPLNPDIELPGIDYFSVPQIQEQIDGPESITLPASALEYSVPGVFNAESYEWSFPEGASGSSATNMVEVDFSENFTGGDIKLRCFRDGFGHSQDASLAISVDFTGTRENDILNIPENIFVYQTAVDIIAVSKEIPGLPFKIYIFDSAGKLLVSEEYMGQNSRQEIKFPISRFSPGLFILVMEDKDFSSSKKFFVY